MSTKESFFVNNPITPENERVRLFPINVEFATRKGCFLFGKLHIIYVLALILVIGILAMWHHKHEKNQELRGEPLFAQRAPYAAGNEEDENLTKYKRKSSQLSQNLYPNAIDDDPAEGDTLLPIASSQSISDGNEFRTTGFLESTSEGIKDMPTGMIENEVYGRKIHPTGSGLIEENESTSSGKQFKPAKHTCKSEGNNKPRPVDIATESMPEGSTYEPGNLIEDNSVYDGNRFPAAGLIESKFTEDT